jgi:hypothetical protein
MHVHCAGNACLGNTYSGNKYAKNAGIIHIEMENKLAWRRLKIMHKLQT